LKKGAKFIYIYNYLELIINICYRLIGIIWIDWNYLDWNYSVFLLKGQPDLVLDLLKGQPDSFCLLDLFSLYK
jgi:hypothetical protein